jgi:hypothetical protein
MATLLRTNGAELDEFDEYPIPDLFTDADLDWTQLLATPVPTQSTSRSSSPDYFSNDLALLDGNFFAQLDMLETPSSAFFSAAFKKPVYSCPLDS